MAKIKDVLLEAPDDIKAATYLNNNVDDKMLGAALKETQEIHLQSIIGSNLFYRLQELVYNAIEGNEDTIDDAENAAYKILLDDYVQPYIEAKVQAVLPLMITYKTRNLGLTKADDDNVKSADSSDIMLVQNRYNTVADKYATALSKYLCKNKSSYPELDNSDCGCIPYVAPMLGKRFVNTGLWLGGDKHNCCCE